MKPENTSTPPAADAGSQSDQLAAAPVIVKLGEVRWHIRSEAIKEQLQSLLQEPEALLAQPGALIHDTWLVRMVRLMALGLNPGALLLRRSNYAKPSARMKDVIRLAAPLRAFHNALALERAGFPTPRVLAAGVACSFYVPHTGYLLVEEIASATTLARLTSQPEGIPRRIVLRVAEEIARLHEHGFVHGDLTINNILLDEKSQPWFIDLERGRFRGGPLTWRQAVEDFHRFARHFGKFSPAAQWSGLRLLKCYCCARGWHGRTREFANALAKRLRHKLDADAPPR